MRTNLRGGEKKRWGPPPADPFYIYTIDR